MAELSSWQSYRVIKKFNNYFKFCGFLLFRIERLAVKTWHKCRLNAWNEGNI